MNFLFTVPGMRYHKIPGQHSQARTEMVRRCGNDWFFQYPGGLEDTLKDLGYKELKYDENGDK